LIRVIAFLQFANRVLFYAYINGVKSIGVISISYVNVTTIIMIIPIGIGINDAMLK